MPGDAQSTGGYRPQAKDGEPATAPALVPKQPSSMRAPAGQMLREQIAVNAWQGRKIARLMKALRFVADHSNDPGVVREAEAALAYKDRADG